MSKAVQMKVSPAARKVMDELDHLRTRDDAWQIPRAEAEALYELVLSHQYTLGVEIGTSYGYSGLHFAAALAQTGGKLHTIDVSQKKFDASRLAFERAGLPETIINHLGDARNVLATIVGRFDFAFLDAVKEQTREYFNLVWPRIRPGGVVLTDNVTTHASLQPFVRFLRSLPDADSSTLKIGNGVEVTFKKKH
jgi:predicted O-methyltransferase YrrM